jgi:hypothetical protein
MQSGIKPLDRYYRDQHGTIVNVIGYDSASQKVIYRRPGYDWECASPLILFRSRFTRVEK